MIESLLKPFAVLVCCAWGLWLIDFLIRRYRTNNTNNATMRQIVDRLFAKWDELPADERHQSMRLFVREMRESASVVERACERYEQAELSAQLQGWLHEPQGCDIMRDLEEAARRASKESAETFKPIHWPPAFEAGFVRTRGEILSSRRSVVDFAQRQENAADLRAAVAEAIEVWGVDWIDNMPPEELRRHFDEGGPLASTCEAELVRRRDKEWRNRKH